MLDALRIWDPSPYVNEQTVLKSPLEEFLAVPFRGDGPASEILSRMLNSDTVRELQRLETGMNVRDLLPVRQHLEALRSDCHCVKCGNMNTRSPCEQDLFITDMSSFVAVVVALSLFHCSEALLVHLHHDMLVKNEFSEAVRCIIASKGSPVCSTQSVLGWALMLVGHQMAGRFNRLPWAMSCFKGQAVYPTIFEQCQVRKEGYLALSWLPGLLKHSGDVYAHVCCGFESSSAPRQQVSSEKVLRPVNIFPGYTLDWRITPRERFLELSLVLRSAEEGRNYYNNPWHIFSGHSRSLILESCGHNRDIPLKQAEPRCTYTSPYRPCPESAEEIAVVAVDGASHLQFFSMGMKEYPNMQLFVFRIDACLECCLDLCRKADYGVIVL